MTPEYYIPPQFTPEGFLRLRGGFDDGGKSLRFDMLFDDIQGGWQLQALSVAEMDVNAPK